jgi:hypothetical protein
MAEQAGSGAPGSAGAWSSGSPVPPGGAGAPGSAGAPGAAGASLDGPSAAALVAAGAGCAAFGLAIVLAEASKALKAALNWYDPVGPLGGKSGVGVIAWLAAWAVLHLLWRDRSVPLRPLLVWTWLLVALGLLGTFPPFFELFAP